MKRENPTTSRALDCGSPRQNTCHAIQQNEEVLKDSTNLIADRMMQLTSGPLEGLERVQSYHVDHLEMETVEDSDVLSHTTDGSLAIGRQREQSYDNWCAVAAYFDGDGSVFISKRQPHILGFVLEWSDNFRPQLTQLKEFLTTRGVVTGEVKRRKVENLHRLRVSSWKSVLKVGRAMLATRCMFKKRRELTAVVSYLGGDTTGNEVFSVLNDEVVRLQRVSKKRYALDLPLSHPEGLLISRERIVMGAQKSSKLRAVLTRLQVDEIRERHDLGISQTKLAGSYGVSRTTIAKALGRVKGHVATID